MAATSNYLAIDLGASSGRAMLGRFDGERLEVAEVHRFDNGPVRILDRLHWDAPRLLQEIQAGLARCAAQGVRLDGVGIDTWGVDFALLSAAGELLDLPRHYRDSRTRGMFAEAFRRVPREEIYARTGIQFMELNTLYQLLALRLGAGRLLDAADMLLFMPDLLGYWLTGERRSEYSIASTSQLLDARRRTWAGDLLDRLDLPARIMPPVADPGTPLGALHSSVLEETGLKPTTVIAPGCHDTACAVAAVPAVAGEVGIARGTAAASGETATVSPPRGDHRGVEPADAESLQKAPESTECNQFAVRHSPFDIRHSAPTLPRPLPAREGESVAAGRDDWAYISSGTWSLVGVELDRPITTADALAANFTNEGGVAGTIRFLSNVAGLWLVQECRRTWADRGEAHSFQELADMAAAAPPRVSFVDPDSPLFAEPGDMPSRIRDRCAATGQPVPQSKGEVVRCALESLALKYDRVLRSAERLTGRVIRVVHVVGGGVHNRLLCQLTADATGKPVVAGPAEATAIGNIMVQALATGRVGSLAEIRQIVARSTRLERYEPRGAADWDEARARFATLLSSTPECGR